MAKLSILHLPDATNSECSIDLAHVVAITPGQPLGTRVLMDIGEVTVTESQDEIRRMRDEGTE